MTNALEITFIATKRSGHHAVLEWTIENRPGTYSYLNDIDPAAPVLKEAVYVSGRPEVARRALASTPKSLLLLSYENRTLEEIGASEAFRHRQAEIGASGRRIAVLLVRDPVNAFASMVKIYEERPDTIARKDLWYGLFWRAWLDHARAFLGETDHLASLGGETLKVSYNLFLRDAAHRSEIRRRLDLADDRPILHLSHLARGGDTYFADRAHYRPDPDVLERRWEAVGLVDDLRRPFADPEVFRLSQLYYEAVGMADRFQPVLEQLRRPR